MLIIIQFLTRFLSIAFSFEISANTTASPIGVCDLQKRRSYSEIMPVCSLLEKAISASSLINSLSDKSK